METASNETSTSPQQETQQETENVATETAPQKKKRMYSGKPRRPNLNHQIRQLVLDTVDDRLTKAFNSRPPVQRKKVVPVSTSDSEEEQQQSHRVAVTQTKRFLTKEERLELKKEKNRLLKESNPKEWERRHRFGDANRQWKARYHADKADPEKLKQMEEIAEKLSAERKAEWTKSPDLFKRSSIWNAFQFLHPEMFNSARKDFGESAPSESQAPSEIPVPQEELVVDAPVLMSEGKQEVVDVSA